MELFIVGIGLLTAVALSRTMGASLVDAVERLEYTVIGDTVNLASRLDEMTKEVDTSILLNETTARAIHDWVALQPVGQLAVRGKERPVPVYTLPQERPGQEVPLEP